jgi:multiple sugar transport system ATP-binding protein
VAKVVIENVYKSFPPRPGEKVSTSTIALSELEPSASQKHLGGTNVLRQIDLDIKDGEFMVLVGASGCGKSTLLRLIAGLEEITGGKIWVGDRLVNELPPKERDIAMVFQNYALYPHMNVYDNIAFGLRRMQKFATLSPSKRQNETKGMPIWIENLLVESTRSLPSFLHYKSRRERELGKKVREVAQLLQIDHLLGRLPKQLSGGQKQRVALGRAIARQPQVFLMDEPLSNLDAKLRAETRTQIVKLQRDLGITTIYVTHDQTEAMTMGDRIAVMNAGQIQQVASPLDLYNAPQNKFVAEFIGSPPMNFVPVQVKAPLAVTYNEFRLTLPEIWEPILQKYNGRSLLLGIRPEHLSLSLPAPKNICVEVDVVEALGNETYISAHLVDPPNSTVQIRIPPDRTVQISEKLWLALSVDKIHLFDPDTTEAIRPAV